VGSEDAKCANPSQVHMQQAASPLEATTCDIYTEGDGQCKTIAAAHRKVNLDDMKNVCGLARSAEAYIYAALNFVRYEHPDGWLSA